ncbi:MAG: bifunctional diaminohydroxyphosphoribosylaminopyrimidine deaminase/5-amino-6-(5-phosphoribosylamino)uracil reductase RibD [Ignavibacteria bacterium]|nr:bifunctional diaminohydroxyphosphoribosylaminopyrimidine deaminase/5-amino-6-(5-phosphoribosylamino)uracil reductase RibD [Ignavibacteria bacterium]
MLDESYIQIAIELAKKGKGKVSPGPLVGSLLVKNDKIIGASYRNSPNDLSTEIIAIKGSNENPEGSILYTNFEPCSISEKDFNCLDQIIESKIKRIVVGSVNPNPSSGGNSIKKLKKTGIEVITGVLEKEGYELNRFYFKHSNSRLPYVTLKMATTIDGKIADNSGNSKWITSVESRSMSHQLRSEYDAVLVGYNTVKKDNPQLTVRLVEGRNPKRIILDTELKTNPQSDLIQKNYDKNLILVTSKKNKTRKKKLAKFIGNGVEIIFAPDNKKKELDLSYLLKKLGEQNISSLLVEGGGKVFSNFINDKLEDEILIFVGPKILGKGYSLTNGMDVKELSKAVKFQIKDYDKVGEDLLIRLIRR